MAESNLQKPTQIKVTVIKKDFYSRQKTGSQDNGWIDNSTPRIYPDLKSSLPKELQEENDCLDNNSEIVWEPRWGDLSQPFDEFENFELTKNSSKFERKQHLIIEKQDKQSAWYEHVKNRLKLRKLSMETLKKVQETKELEECTFRPKLSKRGNQMSPGDRFSKLYEDAVNKKSRMKKRSEQIHQAECPFAPAINNYTSCFSFREIDNQTIESEFPEETEHLFKPAIGRPPKVRNFASSEIGEHLYSMSLTKRADPVPVKPCSYVAKKSERLYNKMKDRKFQEIFEDLKPDNGYIYKNSIWKADLGAKINEILTPIFQEMDDRMDFKEFKLNLDFLFKLLCVTDRQEIIKYKQRTRSKLKNGFKFKHSKSKSSTQTARGIPTILYRLSFVKKY